MLLSTFFFGILQRGDDLAPFFGFHFGWAF
jgi:hypothetical protein